MKKRLISPNSKLICDICGTEITEDMESFENDEGFDFCENCWHEENEHQQCDQCCEWFKEEELDDDELCKFCKE